MKLLKPLLSVTHTFCLQLSSASSSLLLRHDKLYLSKISVITTATKIILQDDYSVIRLERLYHMYLSI